MSSHRNDAQSASAVPSTNHFSLHRTPRREAVKFAYSYSLQHHDEEGKVNNQGAEQGSRQKQAA
jgi:hypothetical protein